MQKSRLFRGWKLWVTILPMFGSVAMAGFFSSSVELYVSPAGSDTNSGSQGKPVASLARARDLARPQAGNKAVTVHVADGMYYLPETLVFTPADSGSEKRPVVYKADNEGGAVLSGGSKLDLNWTAYKDGIFQAKTSAGLEIDQLFINETAQRMARYPNYDPEKKTVAYQGYAVDAFSKERAANWADPTGGYIHAMHLHRWGGYHYRITGKDTKGEVTYEGGWQNNRQMGMHKKFRMVENIFEELDAPGEWFHNAKTSMLYYMPTAGIDMANAKVEVVRLRHLVEFQGTQAAPVKFISLQGFTVRHAARTFMDCKEPLLRSDWAIYRGGAFLLTGTEDVSILDCEFDRVGGNAVFVNNYNRRVKVAGCHIHDTGASGVCFVGDPKAVRDPLFEYNEVNDLSKIDRTPGPKTDNYPADSIVEDCLIHGIGRVERQPAAVQISMAQGITVRDVSIYDCARSGINVSEGTWGGHLIEGCDVFDTVLETKDHGSFNSWGRDRYWRSDVTPTQEAVDQDPKLPFLDAVKTTVIRNSRWRCDHGWDIDLDDGSSNYDIYNNLLLAKGLKLREGFRRHAWNNVVVNNGLHPHVWYEGNNDQVYGNILMSQHRPARILRPNADSARVDQNLYFVANESRVKAASDKLGWDKNSIFGDPQFVDPSSGDFRVKEGSPAFDIGFKNFPMNQFGVKKPSLKKIARTPLLPTLGFAKAKAKPQASKKAPVADVSLFQLVWLGATLQTLEGEEFSAYGVSQEDGGVVLTEVSKDSEAARRGLEDGDVVQQINGTAVRTSDALLQACSLAGSKPLTLKIVRNQQAKEVVIAQHAWVQLETATVANEFKGLPVPAARTRTLSSSTKTGNDPLNSLVDGQLANSYGPVFANGVRNGGYKMDLGSVQTVSAIRSWSCQHAKRGAQRLTLYGSASDQDPGWNADKWTPIGSIDTRGNQGAFFEAASLQAADSESLGKFRWILWKVAPVTSATGGEHTAFQELQVKCVRDNSSTSSNSKATLKKESIEDYTARMQWFVEANYGMFIHFGLYSQLGGVWKGEQVRGYAEWIQGKANIDRHEYAQLSQTFNPVQFDADFIVRTAKEAGMTYLVITAKHHEGFCLWDSQYTDFDVAHTPFKARDLLAELSQACKTHGIKFGLYYSIIDWNHPSQKRPSELGKKGVPGKTVMVDNRKQEYVAYQTNQVLELIKDYDPALIWFDADWANWWTMQDGIELYNAIRDASPSIIVNNRVAKRAGFELDFVTQEQHHFKGAFPKHWEGCYTMNKSWGYKKHDTNWKSAQIVYGKLKDINEKGGNLLLNVGPDGSGQVQPEAFAILKQTAELMKATPIRKTIPQVTKMPGIQAKQPKKQSNKQKNDGV